MRRLFAVVLGVSLAQVACGGDAQRAAAGAGAGGGAASASSSDGSTSSSGDASSSTMVGCGGAGGSSPGCELPIGSAALAPPAMVAIDDGPGASARGRRIAVDSLGNTVTVAHVKGPVTVGGQSLPEVGSETEGDLLVVKRSPAGVVAWARRPSSGGDYVVDPGAAAVAITDADEIVVVGQFEGTADFGAGPVTSSSYATPFVAKYDPSGGLVWLRTFDQPSGIEAGAFAVAVAPSGDIVVGGDYRGTIDFGLGPHTSVADTHDMFVVDLASDGQPVWDAVYGGDQEQVVYDLAVDADGRIAFTGYLGGLADFGGGAVGAPGGAPTVPIVVLDAAGEHLWSRALGADALSHRLGQGIAFDPCGDVVVTGVVDAPVDFGDGVETQGNEDAFLARYDRDGGLVWAKRFATKGSYAAGHDVAVSASGVIFVAGRLEGHVSFGGDDLGTDGPPNGPLAEGFVAAFDRDGAHLSSLDTGLAGVSGEASAYGVALVPDGEIAVTGPLSGTSKTLGLSSTGGAYVARFAY